MADFTRRTDPEFPARRGQASAHAAIRATHPVEHYGAPPRRGPWGAPPPTLVPGGRPPGGGGGGGPPRLGFPRPRGDAAPPRLRPPPFPLPPRPGRPPAGPAPRPAARRRVACPRSRR